MKDIIHGREGSLSNVSAREGGRVTQSCRLNSRFEHTYRKAEK